MSQKLTQRTVLATTPDNADLMHVVDVSDTTDSAEGTSKQVTVANLLAGATVADASTTVKGKVELATDAEAATNTDTVRAITPSNGQSLVAGATVAATGKTTPVDADSFPIVDSAASNVLKELTWANLKATLLTWLRLTTTIIPQNSPQGFLINGKLVPSVTASDLTVAIKTLAGTDPSTSDPVYVRIGDTIRTISAALSVTKNDGTNWFNAGSAELATKEIDYFVYLGYNATDGVTIGFSRIPGANQYSDFSTTTTNEKYCAISTITTAASTDYYENIGRFAATLSAGAGYTWTVPTFTASNLIQRPIYETRDLSYSSTITGFSGTPTQNCGYKLIGNRMFPDLFISGTSNSAAFTATLPFNVNMPSTSSQVLVCWVQDNGTASSGRSVISDGGASITFGKVVTADGGFTTSGGKGAYLHINTSI